VPNLYLEDGIKTPRKGFSLPAFWGFLLLGLWDQVHRWFQTSTLKPASKRHEKGKGKRAVLNGEKRAAMNGEKPLNQSP